MTVPEDLTYTGENFAEKITLSECGETVTVLGKEFKPENTIGNLTIWIRTITTRYGYVTDEIINAGEYIIKYTYNDGTNEYWFDKSIEVKESEATITITAQPKTLQGGGKVTLTVTTEPEGLECDVDCSDNNIDIKDNGNGVFTAEFENKTAEYKFYVYLDEVNYDADEEYVTVSVTEKTESTGSSSSGGGGGSLSRYYNDIDVKEDNDTFGTVTVNPKTANKGEEITITVEPKTGFEVDTVTVKYDNNEVDVEKISDTEYTFIHPGKPTGIYVSYVKAEPTEVPEEVQPDTLPFDDVSAGAWYRKAVEYAYEKGIMSGTGENMFLPNIEITRGMIVSIIWRLEGSPVVNYAINFSDVDPSMYYSEAVRWAVSQGIANGMGDGTFGGYNNITREQLAVMLYNYAKLKGYDTTQGGMAIREFADYENISDYAKEALTWAVNAGIINGMGDGTLAPQGSATRAEAAQMIKVFCEKYN